MIVCHKAYVGCLVLGVLTAGCASDKPLHAQLELPSEFENGTAGGAAAWPGQDWYRGFSSDELNTFVELASHNNWDLAGATARIAQADARARQAGAAILPKLDTNGNANYLAGHSTNGTAHETDWSALLSASYEVDFWGKNRATANAAQFSLTASRADRDTLALTTLAGVANGYFQVLALRERLAIARSNFDTARKLLALVQARSDVGMATPAELAGQKVATANAGLQITELEQQESEARAAMAILVGGVPEGFAIVGQPLDSLTEPVIAAGLPADLLTRRPDVLAAEANLRSAHADLAAARAAMFPSFALTAAGGLQNPALSAAVLTLPGTGLTLSLGASLVQTIFDRGRLRAVRDETEAKDRELLAAYHSAIVAALIDVENALSAIHSLDTAREYQTESLTQSEQAFEGAKLRYQAGSGDFLALLDAQRTLYIARDQFIQYKLARLRVLVELCKALGGGWTPPIASPGSGVSEPHAEM
jgi:NodT family efflux transporter outer membrane factor (OMF) lipoprotein